MAERPVFIPSKTASGLVEERVFEIQWASGFAVVQKKRNVQSLHRVAAAAGFSPLLEISTKSEELVGQRMSAFNLKIPVNHVAIPLECAYQGSKVFERGGPFRDLYETDPKSAKQDRRLKDSGRLIEFNFLDLKFPLTPQTVFYDWLYINAIYAHREWVYKRLTERVHYMGFTDIEFNPSKSINCQARSCALFVSLFEIRKLDAVVTNPADFIEFMRLSWARDDAIGRLKPSLAI